MLYLFLLLGTLSMILVSFIIYKDYSIPFWKALVGSILLTVIGFGSVKLMFFIENGEFSGVSFFGAMLFIPLFSIVVAKIIKVNYYVYMDIAAPSVAIMLALMKINCMISGCCQGMIIGYDSSSNPIRFPSQIVEFITALILCIILILLIKKKGYTTLIFPIFMVFYGSLRFLLNLFREAPEFFFGLPIGNMWAIITIMIGVVWFVLKFKVNNKKNKKA